MSASTSANTSTSTLYTNQHQVNVTPTRQPMQQNQMKPLSSIPAHVRSEIPSLGSTSISTTGNVISADIKGKGPAHPTGLHTPITPLHPPQRPHLNPPRQPDRMVSFTDHQQASTTRAPSVAVATIEPEPQRPILDSEADESFGFNSDDDAFFALADLGPPIDADGADAGRPIDSEEGRPIHSDEGLLDRSVDDAILRDDVFDQRQHQNKLESSVIGIVSVPKLSRREMIAAAIMSAKDKPDTTSTSDLPQGHEYGDERQASGSGFGNTSGSNPTTSGIGTGAGASIVPEIPNKISFQANATNTIGIQSSKPPQQYQNQTSVLNLTSLVQQKHQRHMAQQRNQNENRNPTASSSSSKDGSKRASTPLIGGFHFPSGIVRPHFAGFETMIYFFLKNPLQQANLNTSSTTSSSGIGSKRPAEAMA